MCRRSVLGCKYLILFATILFSLSALGQDTATINQIKADFRMVLDSLSKKDSTQPIGVIILNPDPVAHYYTYVVKSGKIKNSHGWITAASKLNIDRVSLLLHDGYIIDLNVYSGEKHFSNLRAPIGITQSRFQKLTDKLYNVDDASEYVLFREVVRVDSLTSYVPADGFYELNPTLNKLVLVRKVGVNTVVDVRVFTDALGLFGNTSNAVVQTDARIKQSLHRMNWRNTGLYSFQYIKAKFNYSKFTDKDAYVFGSDAGEFSRTSVLQHSFLNAELSTDILHGPIGFKSINIWYFEAGADLHESKLAMDGDTSNILSGGWFGELGIEEKASDNAGFNVYLRILDEYSPQTTWQHNGGSEFFFRPGFEVYWNPFNDEANRLFARMNYTVGAHQSEKKNSYFQLQFGYSLLLSSVLKK